MQKDLKERLSEAMYDVEHALGMYAKSYCTLPAMGIYDQESLAPMMEVIQGCHIYLIGFVPTISLEHVKLEDGRLSAYMSVLGKTYEVPVDCPGELKLEQAEDGYTLLSASGERYGIDPEFLQARLCAISNVVDFDVKYIGQAYGADGSRNALDRLLKHETLQKISLRGVPETHRLTLLLLETLPNGQLFTFINPFAKNKDEDGARTKAGIAKLYDTNEQERITLYEASLIRYFSPEYNKEFKNSFPSTNLKVLQDCYDKDFSALIAEICFDGLPFRLCSSTVPPANHHIAKHALHEEEGRKIFFSM